MSVSRKVLLVDNNVLDVIPAEKGLSSAGFDVTKMASPNGVLAKLDYVKPDFLVLDITMPRLNVDDLLTGIRQDSQFEEMVVVLFSDLDAGTLQQMCVDNDIHGYFCKSMGIDRLGEFLLQFYEN